MILTLIVFFNALKEDSLSPRERSADEPTGLWICLAIACFFSHSFFLYKHLRYLHHSIKQSRQAAHGEESKWTKDGWNFFWNVNDFVGLFLSWLLMFFFMTRIDWMSMTSMRVVAATASLSLLLKMFDWLRIFDLTGFLIELI